MSMTHYIRKANFDEKTLCCPHKNTNGEIFSNQYNINNVSVCIKHIIKVVIITEESLHEELPSTSSWKDLYSYIFFKCDKINPKEAIFYDFIGFMCFTKCNEEGTTYLSIVCVNDADDCKFGKGVKPNQENNWNQKRMKFGIWIQDQCLIFWHEGWLWTHGWK